MDMCDDYVWWLCVMVTCRCDGYGVWWLCVVVMCDGYVWWLCAVVMCGGYEWLLEVTVGVLFCFVLFLQ